MTSRLRFLVILWMTAPAVTSAQSVPTPLPLLLPPADEALLAASAAPPLISDEATIYVLERGGYTVHREGSNGFTCLVERSHPSSLEPICFDEVGSTTVLARVLDAAALREAGADSAAVARALGEGYRSGRYRAPQQAGIAYMLSPDTRFFNPSTGEVEPGHPHLMIYAPYLRNRDIGSPGEAALPDLCTPFVIQEGTPEAYLIVMMADCGSSGGENGHGG